MHRSTGVFLDVDAITASTPQILGSDDHWTAIVHRIPPWHCPPRYNTFGLAALLSTSFSLVLTNTGPHPSSLRVLSVRYNAFNMLSIRMARAGYLYGSILYRHPQSRYITTAPPTAWLVETRRSPPLPHSSTPRKGH